MTAWQFELKNGIVESIDASKLRLAALVGQSRQQIEQMPLPINGQVASIGEAFTVSLADTDEASILFRGDLKNVHGLAAQHSSGRFLVEGNVGDYFAAGCSGGVIELNGNAGDFVGGAVAGKRLGASGGIIHCHRDIGSHGGHRMRRGLLIVDGDAGPSLGASMIAGTIGIAGNAGPNLGCEMKRGTILLRHPWSDEFARSPRYSEALAFNAGFLRLFRAEPMKQWLRSLLDSEHLSRVRADVSAGGMGEILFAAGV
ncbi:MAG: formylmethanofuran dehydrogenase subunit C [Planctomycetota bacterium]